MKKKPKEKPMQIDTKTFCPMCGHEVKIVGTDEETQHYVPVNCKKK